MPSAKSSIPARLLGGLAFGVYHYPRLFFYPQVLLFVLSVYYTVQYLQFDMDRNKLVDSKQLYHQKFLDYRREFGQEDDLVTVVESELPEKNRQFVERLGARLDAETNLFNDVLYKGDLKVMGRKALLFLSESNLHDLHQTLRDFKPFIQNFARTTNLNSMFRLVNQQFRTAARETNESNDSLIKALPAMQRIVDQAADSLIRPGAPPSPGLAALFGGGDATESSQYIMFASNRIYLATAKPKSEKLNEAAVVRLRELVEATQREVPGVNVGITGEPVLELDELNQSQKDSTLATIISLILCAIIYIYGFKETGRPIKATCCLVVGLGYTMAFATFAIGHLNILTITFVPMLIGMAIDFGVHLTSRYEEELRRGRTEWQAIEKAIVFTGLGIFTGCFTTAGAFLAMGFTDFKGVKEMGIICGGGLLICLLPMMTMLPVLLLRGKQNILDHTFHEEMDRRARLERLWLERPVVVVAGTVVLCVLALLQFRKVYFDYNLLNMQSAGLPAVVYERKLINSTSKSVIFCAVVTDSLEKAAAIEAKARTLSTVGDVDSMTRFLTGDQREKLKLIGEVKREVASMFAWPNPATGQPDPAALRAGAVSLEELDEQPVDVKELSDTLNLLQAYLMLASNEVQKEGQKELYQQLWGLRQSLKGLRERLRGDEAPQVAQKLAAFQQALFNDIRDTFATLNNQDDSAPLRPQDLPQALRDRFIGRTGKYLIQIYPKEDVWDRKPQEAFVTQLRQELDPYVTGEPVQLLEYTTKLKNSYIEAAYYALGAIAVLVFLHFRRISCVILSLLPVAIGTVWMVGWMGWRGIPFNLANIMTLPLVIGIGVTSGIHILNRFAEEANPGILAKSTGMAVIVSALTTVAGFGSLIIAKHQGIASLGMVMAVGTATCMFAALTFLPALMKLMIKSGWKMKQPSDESKSGTGSGGTEVKTSN